MNFSKIIKEVLAGHQMSESDLARELGISQPSVHRLKTGETKEPSYRIGAKLVDLHKAIAA